MDGQCSPYQTKETNKARSLGGVTRWIERCCFILLVLPGILFLSNVYVKAGWVIFPTQYYALFYGMALAMVFFTIPASTRGAEHQVPWYDIVLAILSFAVGLYVSINWFKLMFSPEIATLNRWIPGAIAIVLSIEGIRRTMGLVFTAIVASTVLFARFGYLVPYTFYTAKISWQRLFDYLYLDTSALFGLIMAIVSTMVLGFILFGALLNHTGAGTALTNFALSVFGRFTGGPAKVAVASSSLFGTISGAVASNVVLTGSMTIPLMKSTGFKPHTAAAIEATASTGGQLMPPVMGAAAFIMAEVLQIPYGKVIIAALFPAVLFYLCLFIQVHLEASKLGLKGLRADELPPLKSSLAAMWILVLPLVALLYMLLILWWPPGRAALIAVFTLLIISYFRKENRLSLSGLMDVIEETGRVMLPIAAVAAGAGIILGAVSLTGAAFAFSEIFGGLGKAYLWLLLPILAVICLILGMGMPTTAIYVLVSVLFAHSLVDFGILPLAAHLFVFYFALMSFITLPVAVAVYIAAPIAGASVFETGWQAMKLGAVGFIVPFIFVVSPELILQGSPNLVMPAIVTAVGGVGLFAVGINGYLQKRIGGLRRTFLILSGIGLMMSVHGTIGLIFNAAGASIAIFVLAPEWYPRVAKVLKRGFRLSKKFGGSS